MKITAVTQFKLGQIYDVMKRNGITNKQLAMETGLTAQTTSKVLNLRSRPAKRTMVALSLWLEQKTGEPLNIEAWPKGWRLPPKFMLSETREMNEKELMDYKTLMLQQETGSVEMPEESEMLALAKDVLSDRQMEVVLQHTVKGRTLVDIGKEAGVSGTCVSAVFRRAIRKIQEALRLKERMERLGLNQKGEIV